MKRLYLCILCLNALIWAQPTPELIESRAKAIFITHPSALSEHKPQFTEQGWQKWQDGFLTTNYFTTVKTNHIQLTTNFLGIESLEHQNDQWLVKARMIVNYLNDTYYQTFFYTISMILVPNAKDYLLDTYQLEPYMQSVKGRQTPECKLKNL